VTSARSGMGTAFEGGGVRMGGAGWGRRGGDGRLSSRSRCSRRALRFSRFERALVAPSRAGEAPPKAAVMGAQATSARASRRVAGVTLVAMRRPVQSCRLLQKRVATPRRLRILRLRAERPVCRQGRALPDMRTEARRGGREVHSDALSQAISAHATTYVYLVSLRLYSP
jgi:hypothetical protein